MLVDPTMVKMLAELRLPGQPDPVEDILGVFATDGREVLGRLLEAHQRSDAEGVRQSSHRLRGAAANVGAVALSASMETIERAARDGDASGGGVAMAELDALFERSLRALRELA